MQKVYSSIIFISIVDCILIPMYGQNYLTYQYIKVMTKSNAINDANWTTLGLIMIGIIFIGWALYHLDDADETNNQNINEDSKTYHKTYNI